MPYIRLRVYGDGEAARLGAHLINQGDGRLKNRLYTAIRRANAGVEAELRASARRVLPTSNGLGPEIARNARISVRRSFSAVHGVGITVRATHKYHLRGLDKGLNIHPLFGNRRHWYRQAVTPRWFTGVMEDRADRTKHTIERTIKSFVRELEG